MATASLKGLTLSDREAFSVQPVNQSTSRLLRDLPEAFSHISYVYEKRDSFRLAEGNAVNSWPSIVCETCELNLEFFLEGSYEV